MPQLLTCAFRAVHIWARLILDNDLRVLGTRVDGGNRISAFAVSSIVDEGVRRLEWARDRSRILSEHRVE